MIDGCHAMLLITRLGISFFLQLLSWGLSHKLRGKKKKLTKTFPKISCSLFWVFFKLLLWKKVVGEVFSGMEIPRITLLYTVHVHH
jgi:hypothetical protein